MDTQIALTINVRNIALWGRIQKHSYRKKSIKRSGFPFWWLHLLLFYFEDWESWGLLIEITIKLSRRGIGWLEWFNTNSFDFFFFHFWPMKRKRGQSKVRITDIFLIVSTITPATNSAAVPPFPERPVSKSCIPSKFQVSGVLTLKSFRIIFERKEMRTTYFLCNIAHE